MKKNKLALLMAAVMAASLAGCSGSTKEAAGTTAAENAVETEAATEPETTEAETSGAETSAEAEAEAEDEENYDTGDASMDNARNQDEIGEQELLVASFGTSYNDSHRMTIGAIENALEAAFPDYSVRTNLF